MANDEKKFVIKHTFEGIPIMKNDDICFGKKEKHFNLDWEISFFHQANDEPFATLECQRPNRTNDWAIETGYEVWITSKTGENLIEEGEHRFEKFFLDLNTFMESDELEKYLIDGKLTIEFRVHCKKLFGMQIFDKSTEKFSDVVLVVNFEKFYVSKLFLASQSPFFESLFLGNFKESKQSEIPLKDIDADDFHNFLEVLYGHPVIHDETAEGILRLADMYDAQTVVHRCEEFLIEKSKIKLKIKLELAGKYKLNSLKKKCLSKIKTVADIQSVLPPVLKWMDHDVMVDLFNKLLSLQK